MSAAALFMLLASGPVMPRVAYQTNASSTSTTASYTFTALALGTASPTRDIVVIAAGANATSAVSSLTVGGVSATKIKELIGGNSTSSMWLAAVPTGATGDIVVNWASAQVRCNVAVWAVYDLASTTATATASSNAQSAGASINVSTGGVVIVGGYNNSGGGGSTTPTGYTERYDLNDGSGAAYSGGDFTETAAESPRTITLGWSVSSANSTVVAASFR